MYFLKTVRVPRDIEMAKNFDTGNSKMGKADWLTSSQHRRRHVCARDPKSYTFLFLK